MIGGTRAHFSVHQLFLVPIYIKRRPSQITLIEAKRFLISFSDKGICA
jgi:hypothetical protein